jgi:hypothetical protein
MKKYLILMLTVCVLSLSGCGWFTPVEVVTKVTGTETKRGSGEGAKDKYLAFTKAGVFENTDSYYHWKFNSSDVQNKLIEAEKTGESVKLTYYWIRNNFFSMYQNIIKVEAVGTESLE